MKIVKRILISLMILFILIILKLFVSYFANEIIKLDYKNNSYDTKLIDILYFINFPESYVAYYNHGTILYQIGEYSDAVTKFQEALDHNPPKKKVCKVRINYALSIVGTINKDDTNSVINSKLENAKSILYGDDCAGEGDSSGSDENSDELEEEINEMQDELDKDSDDNDSKDNDEEKQEQEDDDSDLEEKVREQQSGSRSSRNDDYDEIEDYGNYSYYRGKTW